MPNLVPFRITINRADMDLPALVLRNDRTTPLTLTRYREPSMVPRITSAPRSAWIPGDIPLAWTWQESQLLFGVAARDATSEAAARAAIADLTAAVARLSYQVTVTPVDANPETWVCRAGSVEPAADRDYADLAHHDPEWIVSMPCNPIRGVA